MTGFMSVLHVLVALHGHVVFMNPISNIIHNHPQSGSIRIGTLGHIKAWESHMPQDASRLLCSARVQQSARPTLRRVSC